MQFIIREPLLNAQGQVLGYGLAWQQSAEPGPRETDAGALIDFVAEQVNVAEGASLLGEHELFLAVDPALITADALARLPQRGTVIAIPASFLAKPDAVAAIDSLRSQNCSLSLRGADLTQLDERLLRAFAHVEISFSAGDFAAQAQRFRSLELPATRLVARDVGNWEQFDHCAKLGLDAFVGRLHLTPRPCQRPGELNPAQTMVLQLMDMVRQNADVRQLEGVLKRDAALSYKLLRYINSAGFGLGCEIQSLKHAVTMLGYSPLYRWLALLLATAATAGDSPVLLQAAIIRGRFSELLGQSFLPKHEAENLFVAGMFSLLDKLLGIPMELVLEKLQLSEPVCQALLTRQGIYGPFLALAEACEVNSADLDAMAAALCIAPRQINQAHLCALAWAQGLKL